MIYNLVFCNCEKFILKSYQSNSSIEIFISQINLLRKFFMITIGILGDEKIDEKIFQSKYQSEIIDHMDNPDVIFWISDKFLMCARFFHARRFRNCIILHPGDSPSHTIGNYKNKGGYNTYSEIIADLRGCDKIILM